MRSSILIHFLQELDQKTDKLETVDRLERTNLIISKWMLQPNDPGILQYSRYKFKLGIKDICSVGRPPIFQEFEIVVNSPPYDGYMSLGKIIASDSVADEETGQVFTKNSQGLLIDANDLYGKWNQ